ncbi:hypothetical protein Hanom_Chr15g01384641 [Helianthus anomalus]
MKALKKLFLDEPFHDGEPKGSLHELNHHMIGIRKHHQQHSTTEHAFLNNYRTPVPLFLLQHWPILFPMRPLGRDLK